MSGKPVTESSNPDSEDLDLLSSTSLVALMNAEDAKVVQAVALVRDAIAESIDKIYSCLKGGGRLIYVGAGTSGRLGVLDAVECPPTFGTRPEQIVGIMAGGMPGLVKAVEGAEDSAQGGMAALLEIGLCKLDCVVGIAASGRTPFVLGALKYARQQGAVTIGFSCNMNSALLPHSDIAIEPIVGPEIISGSTRLKSGTATKMVLNMLTTGAMVRLGKTYGNLMVDVQATNVKLKQRANHMLMEIVGISSEVARGLLERCDGEMKTAIVVHQLQISPQQARDKLTKAEGHLRKAL
ncbi:MAG: N-acetylmuramic acid 6-phosphate etherase [Pseudomonadales bacterium]|nr:N-acetylmuramic acid 6-phosphate etherase [Pseudomonadales bacterium]